MCFQRPPHIISSSLKAKTCLLAQDPKSSCNIIPFYIIPGPPKPLNWHDKGNLKPVRREFVASRFLNVQDTNLPSKMRRTRLSLAELRAGQDAATRSIRGMSALPTSSCLSGTTINTAFKQICTLGAGWRGTCHGAPPPQ